MKKDFRKDLEKTAKQMILVRRVDTLIKLVLRTIMRNIRVDHAGIFLYDKSSGEYIVKVSRGQKGIKIPEGFARISKNNPIIRYFTCPEYCFLNRDYLLSSKIQSGVKAGVQDKKAFSVFMKQLKDQLTLLRAKVCIPGFFRKDLIGVLFLGAKRNNKDVSKDELSFLSVLSYDVVMAIRNAWLFEDLNSQLETNKKIFFDAVSALGTAIETKDRYTGGHTERVVSYSLEIAENLEMPDVDDYKNFKENLIVAALLHDIGKIGVPEKVLNKKTFLNTKEWEFIHKHPMLGIDILHPIREYEDAISGIKYHHERYDGKGYPFNLKGEEIPLIASIIAVADAFDAMTSERPYRKAMTVKQAVNEIMKNKGKQFNPSVVDAFLRAQKRRG